MKSSILLSLTLLVISSLSAQKNPDAVLMTLENETVTVKDFEYIFKKNSTDEKVTKESLDEYIELFVNYKLKVKAAKDAQLDTNKAFITELNGYRKQLARPYLTDGDLLDKLTQQAYERKKKEIHARHILIRVEADADPQDTLSAWTKINGLRERIVTGGEDFEAVAKGKGGSEDPSVKDNGGDLGFFSVFQMVYPFEEAAYTTPVGETSPIIRTRYGYHILEVLEEREARGQVKVAHIMTKSSGQSTPETMQRSKDKIFEIYENYKNGESFEDLARKFSEDATTSNKGGELPWFGTRKMVKSFEDVSFNLTNIGDVSEPFQTEYGWHIVKKLDEKVIGDFDELRGEIKSKVSKDSRAEVTRASFLNKLRNEYKIKSKDKYLKCYYKSIDSTFFDKEWEMKYPKALEKTALQIEDEKIKLKDFDSYMNKGKRRAGTDNAMVYINDTYKSWKDDELLKYEDSQLEQKHEPFRMLMQEYRDGILLFELTDELVWSKAIKDTLGLQEYYEKNKGNYMWPEQFNSTIYSTSSQDVADQIKGYVEQGLTRDSIMKVINEESQLNVSSEAGMFSKEDKPVFERIQSLKKGIHVVSDDDKTYIIEIINVVAPHEKELKEAKGLITSDYQSFLEAQWISELRSKYNYTVNKDVLYSIADE